MTSPAIGASSTKPVDRSALSELLQETSALTRRLFLQLQRRPSTLVAGVLQPLIWLVLFGALFSRAPEGLLPGGMSYGRFLGAGVIVFTAFSGALNAGLPVMFDREFGFLNRLLVALCVAAARSCWRRSSSSRPSALCRAWRSCSPRLCWVMAGLGLQVCCL